MLRVYKEYVCGHEWYGRFQEREIWGKLGQGAMYGKLKPVTVMSSESIER